MKNFLLKLLILIALFFNISVSFSEAPFVGFNAIYKGYIVTTNEQFPFVVVIYHISQNQNGVDPLCTGSIIGKDWILTAGHCVHTSSDFSSGMSETLISPDTLLVGVVLLDLRKTQAKYLIHVKKVFVFSDKQDMGHDVALLQLADTTDIQPVALPSYNDFLDLKTSQLSATAVGYGWIDERMSNDPVPATEQNDIHLLRKDGAIDDFDGYLHYGDEIIQDDQTVEKFLGIVDDNDKKELEDYMAGRLGVISPDGKRITNGDSGGPLLLTITQKDNSKQYIQIGVASQIFSSVTSNQERYFSMYANLTNRDMLNFINNTMKTNSN